MSSRPTIRVERERLVIVLVVTIGFAAIAYGSVLITNNLAATAIPMQTP